QRRALWRLPDLYWRLAGWLLSPPAAPPASQTLRAAQTLPAGVCGRGADRVVPAAILELCGKGTCRASRDLVRNNKSGWTGSTLFAGVERSATTQPGGLRTAREGTGRGGF